MLNAFIDLLNSIDNSIKISLDAYWSVVVLIDLGVQINLGPGFGHDGLDVLALLSNEHRALLLRNENRKTELLVSGIVLHVLDEKMVYQSSHGLVFGLFHKVVDVNDLALEILIDKISVRINVMHSGKLPDSLKEADWFFLNVFIVVIWNQNEIREAKLDLLMGLSAVSFIESSFLRVKASVIGTVLVSSLAGHAVKLSVVIAHYNL